MTHEGRVGRWTMRLRRGMGSVFSAESRLGSTWVEHLTLLLRVALPGFGATQSRHSAAGARTS